ncbi:hypothetical protein [Clostridium saccharoperbutylacetonicum]
MLKINFLVKVNFLEMRKCDKKECSYINREHCLYRMGMVLFT